MKTGTAVTWISQARGHTTRKTGKIVMIVPANTPPWKVGKSNDEFRNLIEGKSIQFGIYSVREEESYIVEVRTTQKAKPKLYWPIVELTEIRNKK